MNGWKKESGGDVKNQDFLKSLHETIKVYEQEYNINVRFWTVRREWNEEADGMVNQVLDSTK